MFVSHQKTDQDFLIREATEKDIPVILTFIRELAEYEELDVVADEEGLRRELFGDDPAAGVILACRGDTPVGFAVYYVRPEWRGHGIGKALLSHLAALAVKHGCGRFEWWCLDWNTDALAFYDKLGAKPVENVLVLRMTGSALEKTAKARTEFREEKTAP